MEPKAERQAFPMVTDFHPQMGIQAVPGMTLRDWFAGMALMGSYAACKMAGQSDRQIAGSVYDMAEHMLQESGSR